MGVTHLKAWQKIEAAQIVAVCDAVRLPVNGVLAGVNGNLSGADSIQLGTAVKAYQKLEDVLADPEVELVDLCVPTSLHVPQAVAALQAGKHVVCEKPLARTSAQAREIVEAALTARGFFMPAMCMRFWPEWSWLKQAVVKNTYGQVLAARFRRVSEAPGWSKDTYFKGGQSGGALLDLHIHDADFVQFIFGRPTSVYATGLSRFSGAIDHVIAQYQVAGGAVVSAEGSWLPHKGHGLGMQYTVNFEKATADFDLARGKDALRLFEEGQEPRTISCDGPDGYESELRHMAESVLAGHGPTIVTAADGLSAVEICEAEDLSIRHGQPVKVLSGGAN